MFQHMLEDTRTHKEELEGSLGSSQPGIFQDFKDLEEAVIAQPWGSVHSRSAV